MGQSAEDYTLSVKVKVIGPKKEVSYHGLAGIFLRMKEPRVNCFDVLSNPKNLTIMKYTEYSETNCLKKSTKQKGTIFVDF